MLMTERSRVVMEFPQKKYNIIYADPPWRYGGKGRGAALNHYGTMSIDEIKSLPVGDIANLNCYLFLWATGPCMPEAMAAMGAWGFEYKTVAFTWIKHNTNIGTLFYGMGNYTRANPEYVLLGKRGSLERKSRAVHSVVVGPVSEHSTKPKTVRKRITQLFGDLPRIELFARQRAEGWESWGDGI